MLKAHLQGGRIWQLCLWQCMSDQIWCVLYPAGVIGVSLRLLSSVLLCLKPGQPLDAAVLTRIRKM